MNKFTYLTLTVSLAIIGIAGMCFASGLPTYAPDNDGQHSNFSSGWKSQRDIFAQYSVSATITARTALGSYQPTAKTATP